MEMRSLVIIAEQRNVKALVLELQNRSRMRKLLFYIFFHERCSTLNIVGPIIYIEVLVGGESLSCTKETCKVSLFLAFLVLILIIKSLFLNRYSRRQKLIVSKVHVMTKVRPGDWCVFKMYKKEEKRKLRY
jgi:hypothetical protein